MEQKHVKLLVSIITKLQIRNIHTCVKWYRNTFNEHIVFTFFCTLWHLLIQNTNEVIFDFFFNIK